jgi:hypothetical protein
MPRPRLPWACEPYVGLLGGNRPGTSREPRRVIGTHGKASGHCADDSRACEGRASIRTSPLAPGSRPSARAASVARVSTGNTWRTSPTCARMIRRFLLDDEITRTTRSTPLSRILSCMARVTACRSAGRVSASTPMLTGPRSSSSQARRSLVAGIGASVKRRHEGDSRALNRSRRRAWPSSRSGSPVGYVLTTSLWPRCAMTSVARRTSTVRSRPCSNR